MRPSTPSLRTTTRCNAWLRGPLVSLLLWTCLTLRSGCSSSSPAELDPKNPGTSEEVRRDARGESDSTNPVELADDGQANVDELITAEEYETSGTAQVDAYQDAETGSDAAEVLEWDQGVDAQQGQCGYCEALPRPGCCQGSWACGDGTCVFQCVNGASLPQIWDLESIAQEETLQVELLESNVKVEGFFDKRIESIKFTSWEWSSGEQVPIRIHAFVVSPRAPDSGPYPAVVLAHTLHSEADLEALLDFVMKYQYPYLDSKKLRLIAMYVSAPGAGSSEGHGAQPPDGNDCVIFNTVPDARGSWFYAYTVALMRAVTYLTTREDVDKSRIAVVGESAGGVAALLASSVDQRVSTAIAISASGGFKEAVEAGSWLATMMEKCGVKKDSKRFKRLVEYLDPLVYARASCSATLLLAGFQDELFPITSLKPTYEALLESGQDVWWVLLPDWDRWYFRHAGLDCSSYPNMWLTKIREVGAVGYWLQRHVLKNPLLQYEPALPKVAVSSQGGTLHFTVHYDNTWYIKALRVFYSLNGACTTKMLKVPVWQDKEVAEAQVKVSEADQQNLVYFAEAYYQMPAMVIPGAVGEMGAVLGLTSIPHIPEGFVPVVRPIPDPQGGDPCAGGPAPCLPPNDDET